MLTSPRASHDQALGTEQYATGGVEQVDINFNFQCINRHQAGNAVGGVGARVVELEGPYRERKQHALACR